MDNKEFFDFVRKSHEGQKRWNGDDYFETHCVKVAEYAVANYKTMIGQYIKFDKIDENLLYNTAIAHDVLEDTDADPQVLKDFDLYLYFNVSILTKKENQSYCDYIRELSWDGSPIAKIVKLSDLTLNRIDLKPSARKDKYDLAELVIMNSLG